MENIDYKGKSITVRSEMGPQATIIDGNRTASVVTIKGVFAVLEGFTVTNGFAQGGGYSYSGGGIYCANAAFPRIINNHITMNESLYYGGGIYTDGSPWIGGNLISDNHSGYGGGGIRCQGGSSLEIVGNRFVSNYAEYGGGGVEVVDFSTPMIQNNVFLSNECEYRGGAIYCYNGSSADIVNNLFIANIAGYYGGGVSCRKESNATITNNTFSLNYGTYRGGGFHSDDASPVMTNCILWNNDGGSSSDKEYYFQNTGTPVINYSDVEGGAPGTGNIDSDPLFVDAAGGDYHLTFPSPCKDGGDNTAVLDPGDYEGDPRIAYGIVDMGADEFYTHLYYTGDATPNGNVQVKFVGLPGAAPVGLCLGSGVLDPPLKSMWGDWYLQFPIIGPIALPSSIPATGVLVLAGSIPGSPPAPYAIPMQAIIKDMLTNLSVVEVE